MGDSKEAPPPYNEQQSPLFHEQPPPPQPAPQTGKQISQFTFGLIVTRAGPELEVLQVLSELLNTGAWSPF